MAHSCIPHYFVSMFPEVVPAIHYMVVAHDLAKKTCEAPGLAEAFIDVLCICLAHVDGIVDSLLGDSGFVCNASIRADDFVFTFTHPKYGVYEACFRNYCCIMQTYLHNVIVSLCLFERYKDDPEIFKNLLSDLPYVEKKTSLDKDD